MKLKKKLIKRLIKLQNRIDLLPLTDHQLANVNMHIAELNDLVNTIKKPAKKDDMTTHLTIKLDPKVDDILFKLFAQI